MADHCFYCGQPTWRLGEVSRDEARRMFGIEKGSYLSGRMLRYRQWTREHLTRRADGGGNAPNNIVGACLYCNSTREDVPPQEHRKAMRALAATGAHPCCNTKDT